MKRNETKAYLWHYLREWGAKKSAVDTLKDIRERKEPDEKCEENIINLVSEILDSDILNVEDVIKRLNYPSEEKRSLIKQIQEE